MITEPIERRVVEGERNAMTTLADLSEGQTATIIDISGDDAIAQRLMEMGLTDGEVISLKGFAPMGDPIEYSIRGYRLSLRRAEAARVIVSPIVASA